MAFTFKLRPEAGTVPFEELDISTRAYPFETPPDDYDARAFDTYGRLTRVLRGMGRVVSLPELMPMTEAELDLLRRWKMNRVRLALSPNWNGNTILYARYNRHNQGLPESVYGPAGTFTRSLGTTNASATQLRADGRYDLLSANVPRFEPSRAGNTFAPATGLRPYGKHKNYFGQSHPKSGALIWTLNNASGLASYVWDANMPRMVTDATSGAGRFIGRSNPDYLSYAVASYDAASVISVGVWLRGEGTFRMVLTGGATSTGPDVVLSPHVWTLLSREGIAATGAAVTVRIEARVTTSWCAVGPAQFNASRRLLGYTHNIANTTIYESAVDDLSYSTLQIPPFGTTIHVGLEMPDLYATAGEQCVLGLDQGGGNRLVLRYRADTNKFSFMKTATGTAVAEWTPQRSAGQGTIITIVADKTNYRAYENSVQVFSGGFGVVEPIALGLHVGWDGVSANDTQGWNGLVYFLRVDSGPLDTTELSYVSSLWNDAQQIAWTRAMEGRLFEIDTPTHRMQADKYFSSLELKQVDATYGATHEVP